MGWRSREQAYNFEQRFPDTPTEGEQTWREGVSAKSRQEYSDAEYPAGLPDRFFDEEGQVNLSKVKAKDALKYMAAMGIKIPVKGGFTRE